MCIVFQEVFNDISLRVVTEVDIHSGGLGLLRGE